MDYNIIADLIAQLQKKTTNFTMTIDEDSLVSFYIVPEWEKGEGYLCTTNFKWFELEAKATILEELLEFVNTREDKLDLSRGKLFFLCKT